MPEPQVEPDNCAATTDGADERCTLQWWTSTHTSYFFLAIFSVLSWVTFVIGILYMSRQSSRLNDCVDRTTFATTAYDRVNTRVTEFVDMNLPGTLRESRAAFEALTDRNYVPGFRYALVGNDYGDVRAVAVTGGGDAATLWVASSSAGGAVRVSSLGDTSSRVLGAETSRVRCLLPAGDGSGTVFLGGDNFLASLSGPDSTMMTILDAAVVAAGTRVDAMALVGGRLYCSGSFLVDGVPQVLASIDPGVTSSLWSSLPGVMERLLSGTIRTCIAGPPGKSSLVLGGVFTVKGTSVSNLAEYRIDTGAFTPFPDSGTLGEVQTLYIDGGYLYVGGDHGVLVYNNVDGDGGGAERVATVNRIAGTVRTIRRFLDHVYVGGSFLSVEQATGNRVYLPYLARIVDMTFKMVHVDGSLHCPDGPVTHLVVQGSGTGARLLVFGEGSQDAAEQHNQVLALTKDGGVSLP